MRKIGRVAEGRAGRVPRTAVAAGNRRRRPVNINKALTLAVCSRPLNVPATTFSGCRLGSLLDTGGEGM
jgi:hypothetical protein